ncbi:MAG: hypothetical protein RSB38_05240 [Oscillospiraceae bacterium]
MNANEHKKSLIEEAKIYQTAIENGVELEDVEKSRLKAILALILGEEDLYDATQDGSLTYTSIANIAEKFGDVYGIDEYINKLSKVGLTSKELQAILSDLMIAKVRDIIETHGASAATENLISKMLSEAGVANAAAVAAALLSEKLNKTQSSANNAASGINNLNVQGMDTSGKVAQANNLTTALNLVARGAAIAAAAVASIGNVANTSSGKGLANAREEDRNYKAWVKENAKKDGNALNSSIPALDFSGIGGSGSGGSKAEDYVVEIDKCYEANKRLKDIQDEIAHNELLSDMTDDAKKQLEYQNQIIELYKKEQKLLSEINNIRREEIKTNIDKLNKVGFEIEYDPANNDFVIKNMSHVNELAMSTRKEYEKLIKKTEALNEANRDGSDKWWDLEKALNGVNKKYKEIIDTAVSSYKSTIDAIQKQIDKEKEVLELRRKAYEDQKSAMETTVDTVVSFIDKQQEALKKENDELDRQVEAQQKLEALEKAKHTNINMYSEGEGFGWEVDQSKVNEAQQEYDKFLRDKELEDKLKGLEDYKKLWQDIIDGYQKGVDEQITAEQLGANWQEIILSQQTGVIKDYASTYNQVCDQLNESLSGSVANQIKNLEDLSDKWDKAYDDIESAANGYKDKLSEVQAFEKLSFPERLAQIQSFTSQAIIAFEALAKAQGSANALSTMQNNSSAWAGASDAERAALAAENQKLGASLGLTYNSSTGTWFNPDGTKAYSNGGVVDYTGIAEVHGGSAAELVLSNADVGNVYDYIHNTPSLVKDMINEVALGKMLPATHVQSPESTRTPNISISEIHVHGVQETSGLAKAIKNELHAKLQQELNKKD